MHNLSLCCLASAQAVSRIPCPLCCLASVQAVSCIPCLSVALPIHRLSHALPASLLPGLCTSCLTHYLSSMLSVQLITVSVLCTCYLMYYLSSLLSVLFVSTIYPLNRLSHAFCTGCVMHCESSRLPVL
jgi:hypothetical protein